MSGSEIAPVLTPEGWALLNQLGPYDAEKSLATSTALRALGHSPELVAAALSQSRLRQSGETKFGPFAANMLFTADGLQQATRLPVAGLHAERYVQAGIEQVADLGCGIGADSMAFAAAGLQVLAVEADETTAAVATVNLMPFDTVTVQHSKAEALNVDDYPGIFVDPARRVSSTTGSKRTWNPEQFSPSLDFVNEIADSGKALGVKYGPGLPHELISEGCEAVWTSMNGSVLEVALWHSVLAREGVRRAAIVLKDGVRHEINANSDFGSDHTEVGELDAYIYEPDGAIIRAQLIGELAGRHQAHVLDPTIAYLSSAKLWDSPFASAYQVIEVLEMNQKKLKAWLRSNKVGVLTIKKRGMDISVEKMRKELLAGKPAEHKNEATLILTRVGNSRLAIAVEPVK